MKPLNEICSMIIPLCREQPAIMAAYLFGSVALGTAKASSDIDVAVLLDERKSDTFLLLPFITRLEDVIGSMILSSMEFLPGMYQTLTCLSKESWYIYNRNNSKKAHKA